MIHNNTLGGTLPHHNTTTARTAPRAAPRKQRRGPLTKPMTGLTATILSVATCAALTSCAIFNTRLTIADGEDGFAAAEKIVNTNTREALKIIGNPEFDALYEESAKTSRNPKSSSDYYFTATQHKFPAPDEYCTREKINEYATRAHEQGWDVRIRTGTEQTTQKPRIDRQWILILAYKDKYNNLFISSDPNYPPRDWHKPQPTNTPSQEPKLQCYISVSSNIKCVAKDGRLCSSALNRGGGLYKGDEKWPN